MASRRTVVLTLTACAAIGLAAVGVGGAVAQQDEEAPTPSADPTDLVDRLGELEATLPETIPPTSVTIDPEQTGGSFEGDPAGLRASLDTVEGDLRQLFIDADDADGEIADAVSIIARGWLDLWHGAEWLAEADAHDLAFPLETATSEGVATGADELRGSISVGLDLILQGRARHLDGYVVLRDEAPAEPDVQALFDARAVAAEEFDTDLRPDVLTLLSHRSTSVWVAIDRFDTDLPGVEPRATSASLVCVDREALQEAGGVVTEENVAALVAATPDRADCPDLPEPE